MGRDDLIANNYILAMCSNNDTYCTQLPEEVQDQLISKMNEDSMYDANYSAASSVVVADCDASAGGYCVISEYYDGGDIHVDLYAPDGRRANMIMSDSAFESLLIGRYFSGSRIHENLSYFDSESAARNKFEELDQFYNEQQVGYAVSFLTLFDIFDLYFSIFDEKGAG